MKFSIHVTFSTTRAMWMRNLCAVYMPCKNVINGIRCCVTPRVFNTFLLCTYHVQNIGWKKPSSYSNKEVPSCCSCLALFSTVRCYSHSILIVFHLPPKVASIVHFCYRMGNFLFYSPDHKDFLVFELNCSPTTNHFYGFKTIKYCSM